MIVPYNDYKAMYFPGQQGERHQAEPLQSGPAALGAAPRLGGRGDAQARQAAHLPQAHVLHRRGQLGRAWRPTSTTRAASCTAACIAPTAFAYDAQAMTIYAADQLRPDRRHVRVAGQLRPLLRHQVTASRSRRATGSRTRWQARAFADVSRCPAPRAPGTVPSTDVRSRHRRGTAGRHRPGGDMRRAIAYRRRPAACAVVWLRWRVRRSRPTPGSWQRRARPAGDAIAGRGEEAAHCRWPARANDWWPSVPRGHIVVSTDAGATWQQAQVPVSSDLTAVYFPSAKHRLGGRPRRRRARHHRRRRDAGRSSSTAATVNDLVLADMQAKLAASPESAELQALRRRGRALQGSRARTSRSSTSGSRTTRTASSSGPTACCSRPAMAARPGSRGSIAPTTRAS